MSPAKHLTGIVGEKPSRYSMSPALWTEAFRTLGVDAEYLPFDVSEGDLASFVAKMRAEPRLKGFNVTTPHKVRVMEFLDEIDPKAKIIGAVNTVVRTEDGKLTGHNTDGTGALMSLTPLIPSFRGIRVLLFGAGGAARAVAFALAEAIGTKGKIKILNRDPAKSALLAEQIYRRYGNAQSISAGDLEIYAKGSGLIINSTTVGQTGPLESSSPMPKELMAKIPADTVFFDLIYSPLETRFLADARLSGKKTLNGVGMIKAQAAEAFLRMWPSGTDARRVFAAFSAKH